jgi:hypothetical protein
MTAADFVNKFVAQLRGKAAQLRAYGAASIAQTCEQIASDLEGELRAWWLADLTIAEAARESGYSEERLRQMAREGTIAYIKSAGTKGAILIARRDLPRRPDPRSCNVASLEERLLHQPGNGLRKPA